MSNSSDFFTSGGGAAIAIQGIQRFATFRPVDFTDETGKRWLQRGSVEVDTATFDTAIWSKKGVIAEYYDDIQGVSNNTSPEKGAIGSTADELWFFTNASSGSNNSQPTISTDGGLTWNHATDNTVPIMLHSAECAPVWSVGKMIGAGKSSTNVVRSGDLGASWDTVDTGTGVNLSGMIGNQNAIVVWGTSGTARRSINGGDTWSNIATLAGSGTLGTPTILSSGIWIIFNNSYDVWISNDEGATWSYSNNTTPTGVTPNNLFTDGTKMFAPAHTSDLPIRLWESSDGVTWTDTGVKLDPSKGSELPTGEHIVVKIGGADGAFVSNLGFTSEDGLNWEPWSPKYFASASTFSQMAIVPTPTGCAICKASGEIYTNEYKLYAGDLVPAANLSTVLITNPNQDWVRIT